MTIIDPTPVLDPPSGGGVQAQSGSILNEILVKIGLSPVPTPGAPTAPTPAPKVNWPAVASYLRWAWPGYSWPDTYNAEQVDANFADIVGRLGAEAQYSWEVGIALQVEIAQLTHLLVVVQSDISAISGELASGSFTTGITSAITNADQAVAALTTRLDQFGSWFNNVFAPGVYRAEGQAADAENRINSFGNWFNTYFAPGVYAVEGQANATARDLSGLHNWIDTNLLPQVGATTALATQTADQLAQTTNTVEGQIGNEATARVAADQSIVNDVIPSAITGLATQVETELQPIRNELDTCVAPLCDTVTPNAKQLGKLGNLLKNLENLGIAAVLAALVGEAVADPDAASAQVIDVGGWAPTFAVELVDAVMG